MKQNLIILSLAAFTLSSCIKTSTCTCKNSKGEVVSESTSGGKRSDVNQFEENCKKTKVREVNNGATIETPCEVK